MLNSFSIVGRIGNAPERKETGSGKAVCNFSIACDRDRKVDGEKVTDWFRVTAWERTADYVMDYLGKGRMVGIKGRIEIRKYEKDGQTREAFEVIAESVYVLDRGDDAPTGGQQRPQGRSAPQGRQQAPARQSYNQSTRQQSTAREEEYDPFADD